MDSRSLSISSRSVSSASYRIQVPQEELRLRGTGESTAEAACPFTFFRLRMAARWVWKVAM